MDLKSGYPFWAIKNGLMKNYPALAGDLRCEVAVVGGGITGALIADELVGHGFDVAIIEQRDVAWGSTAASTALVQYEIDTHLVDLAKDVGEADALAAYRACVDAIGELGRLARELRDVDFRNQDSLYYGSRGRDGKRLREEFEMRERHGLPVQWVDTAELMTRFGISGPGAILSDVAARLDPYRMTHRLLARLSRNGARVFDGTCVAAIEPTERGVTLRCDGGAVVRCNHVVMAAGYANQLWLHRSVASNRSSYAFVTDQISSDDLGFLADTLVWETARPYLYLRSTGDGRLLVGGEDDGIDVPALRDARVEKKARKLCARVKEIYPGLEFRSAYAWAGTFAETSDGLPYFGATAQHGPRVQFAMAYGGNGITYSVIGAGIVRANIQRRKHPLAGLFGFERRRSVGR